MSNFITTIEGDIVAVGEAAWAQTKAELLTLEQEALGIIKADIQAVIAKVEAGNTLEQIETELLNLWAANKPQIISALSSGALQVLISVAKLAVAAI
jgi:hypothetical protein